MPTWIALSLRSVQSTELQRQVDPLSRPAAKGGSLSANSGVEPNVRFSTPWRTGAAETTQARRQPSPAALPALGSRPACRPRTGCARDRGHLAGVPHAHAARPGFAGFALA